MPRTTPKTKRQLRYALGKAWDNLYIAELKAILEDSGYDTRQGWGIARAQATDPTRADMAYAAFEAEQDRLNAAYNAHVNADYLEAEREAANLRERHNASALVEAAQFAYDQHHNHLERIRAGEFAEYGVSEVSAGEAEQEAKLLAELERVRRCPNAR